MHFIKTRKLWFPFLLAILFAAGCGGGGGQNFTSTGGGGGGGTTTASDSAGPSVTVLGINPIQGASGVAANKQITATFAQAMSPGTVNVATFTLSTGLTSVPSASVVYDPATNTATLTPAGNLALSTTFTVLLGPGATNLAGNPLTPFSSTFTTSLPVLFHPSVGTLNPAAGTSGVPTNSVVTATFSGAMNPTTLINANFFLTDPSGALVPGAVTHSADNLSATFTPATGLLPLTTYTVNLTAGATDAAGNSLTPSTTSFTTATPAAPGAPTVQSINPAAGANSVLLNQTIVATFAQAMNPTTLNSPATNFTLLNGATPVAGTVSYDVPTATATFTPASNLASSTTFTVKIGAGATDVAGNSLVPFNSAFTTGAVVASPTASAINPQQGATGVAINRAVTATFNQQMNPATLNSPATTFTLSTGGNPIAGTVAYNAANSTAVFTPTANLPSNSLITVNLTAGAQNLAGNGLTPFSSSFTTGSQVGQIPIVLGATLNNFAVLGGSTVTNSNATTVTGDLGVSPGTSVTGFPPGILLGTLHAGDGTAAQAQVDLTSAFTDASTRGGAPITIAGNIGGQTLPPGLYVSTSSLAISSGDLTLDAKGDSNAVFVFQMASTFTSTTGRQIFLIGGAKSSNVFWSVGTSATLGTFSSFKGTILSQISITVASGATVDGRVVTRTGAVTLDAATVTKPAP